MPGAGRDQLLVAADLVQLTDLIVEVVFIVGAGVMHRWNRPHVFRDPRSSGAAWICARR
jgi:hypothetical protein